jgi:hypothetical protein
VVERRVQVRPQITAAAARADMGVCSTAKHLRSNAYKCKFGGYLIGVKYCLLDPPLLMFVRLLAALITKILYSF